jgi:hypothetical protein
MNDTLSMVCNEINYSGVEKNETWQVQKTHTCTSHEMHNTEMHVLFFCSTETHSGGATYGGEL